MKTFILFSFLLINSLIFAQSTATYNFTFTSSWNETDHTSIPNNAHWSNLVGTTHKTENYFLKTGEVASLGIKNVAELGDNTAFNNEVNNAISTNEAKQWLQSGFSPFAAISSANLNGIEVTEEYHLITLVSMIAPSPDWLISVNSLDLRNDTNTGWKTDFSIDVFAYDSGTDDGVNYDSTDVISSPPLGIFLINGLPFNGNKIGTLTVTLESVLGVTENSIFEGVNVFSNPTEGKITISNIRNIDLMSVEVYNVLGRLIKSEMNFMKNQQNLDINLSNINKGLYVLKLATNKGQILTKKVIVK